MIVKIKLGEQSNYKYSILFGAIVYLISNAYFGWNIEAQSGAERVCDFIWSTAFFGGIFWWMVSGMVRDEIRNIKIKIE